MEIQILRSGSSKSILYNLEIAAAYIRRMINNVHLRMLCIIIIIIHRRKTNTVKHGRKKKSRASGHYPNYYYYFFLRRRLIFMGAQRETCFCRLEF